VGDLLLDMWSDYTIPVYHHSKIFSVIIDQDYWRNKDPLFPEDALIWFTGGSRADLGKRSGIFGIRRNTSFSFPLGKFATVFQAQIYAIFQTACENMRRAYKHKRIPTFLITRLHLRCLAAQK
jgi:hypothetical protein